MLLIYVVNVVVNINPWIVNIVYKVVDIVLINDLLFFNIFVASKAQRIFVKKVPVTRVVYLRWLKELSLCFGHIVPAVLIDSLLTFSSPLVVFLSPFGRTIFSRA